MRSSAVAYVRFNLLALAVALLPQCASAWEFNFAAYVEERLASTKPDLAIPAQRQAEILIQTAEEALRLAKMRQYLEAIEHYNQAIDALDTLAIEFPISSEVRTYRAMLRVFLACAYWKSNNNEPAKKSLAIAAAELREVASQVPKDDSASQMISEIRVVALVGLSISYLKDRQIRPAERSLKEADKLRLKPWEREFVTYCLQNLHLLGR